jgi:hypothetical protein
MTPAQPPRRRSIADPLPLGWRIGAAALALGATVALVDLAIGRAALVSLPSSGAPSAPNQPGTATPAARAVAYLPITLRGRLDQAIQTAAAAGSATARASTATARVVTRTPTASGTPGSTATSTITGTRASAGTPTASPSPSRTATPSATPTATGPTPTPSATVTPSITPTPRKDPAGERLLPAAAGRVGENRVSFDAGAQTYRLSHRGGITVTFELDLRHPDNRFGRLTIRETTSGRFPIAGAGLFYRQPDGNLIEPRLFSVVGVVDAVEHALLPAGDGVRLTVRETLENQAHTKRYTLRLVGAAIEVHAESLDASGVAPGAGGYAGFTAGDIEGSQDGVSIRLPYMDAVPVTMLDHRWFASTLVDYPLSHAGALVPRGPEILPGAITNEVAPIYGPDAAGRIRPVDETVWVTLSPDIADLFALPEQPPSPHRPALSETVHVTLAGRAPDVSFADEAAYVEQLRAWRVTDLQFHKPAWEPAEIQRPAQGPPNPAAGGESGFTALVAAAGGRIAPSLAYTLTTSGCPGNPNPLYRPADRVGGSDGLPKGIRARACPEPSGGEAEAFLLAPDAARRLAEGAAGDLARWGVRAVDLDVLTAWNPAYAWPGAAANVLDEAVAPAHPATIGEAIGAMKRLFAQMQTQVGPVFGSGAFGTWETGYDSFFAGYVDGVARSLSNGSDEQPSGASYLVVPDYELKVIRPRMVGYGMGDYTRFFPDLAAEGADLVRPLTEAELDEWHATMLAYGHAGAWTTRETTAGGPGGDYLPPAEQVKTYFTMRALQSRYLDAAPVSVGYVGPDGVERDLNGALARDFDLAGPRLHLVFGSEGAGAVGGGTGDAVNSNVELWLNHSPDVWTVTAGGTYLLPQNGWLARGDGGLLGYSALVEGRRADFLQAPEVTVLDGRGRLTNFGGFSARDLVVRFPDGWRLEEQTDGRLVWVGPTMDVGGDGCARGC